MILLHQRGRIERGVGRRGRERGEKEMRKEDQVRRKGRRERGLIEREEK